MAVDFSLIGKRIRIKRKEAKITQEQLAEKIDVTVGYVSQCERGISKINLEKLSEIADALNCDIAFFVAGSVVGCEEYLIEEYLEKYKKLNSKEKTFLLEVIDLILKSK